MDYGRILGRAWHLTWRYRALWVFGILLALFTGSSGGGGGSNSGFNFGGGSVPGTPGAPFSGSMSSPGWVAIAIIVLAIIALVFLWAIASVILRYVSEVALMRMVDSTEDTGRKLRWTQGFRLGWSRGAWRLFLIDLVITIPLVIVFVILFVLSLTPLLAWVSGDNTAGIIGTVATIGLFVLVVLLLIVVAIALSVLRQFFYRMAVLRDRGVFESIGQGWALVRARFTQAVSMWLIMVGISIAYGIGMIIVALALLLAFGLVGVVPAVAVYAAVQSFAGSAMGAVAAVLIAVPAFLLVLVAPSLFLSGLWQVYYSSVWTLTFRELAGPVALPAVAPAAEPPAIEGTAAAI